MSRRWVSTPAAAASSRSSPAAAASSASRGPSTNRPCRSRATSRWCSRATASRWAVGRASPVAGHQAGQALRARLQGAEHQGGLVEDADSARVVHDTDTAVSPSEMQGLEIRLSRGVEELLDREGGHGSHPRRTRGMGAHAGREGLGRARRPPRRGRARPALHRPPPRPRGHQPAGLRRAARRRPPGAPPRPDARHRGPQRADPRHRPADRRPGLPHPGRDAARELRRVRCPALPARAPRSRASSTSSVRSSASPSRA